MEKEKGKQPQMDSNQLDAYTIEDGLSNDSLQRELIYAIYEIAYQLAIGNELLMTFLQNQVEREKEKVK